MLLLGVLGCMGAQLRFLNGALRRFDVLYVLPVYQVGLHPIVTSQYTSTTLYQVYNHIQYMFF